MSVSKALEAYFAGRPNENVYEWIEYHERTAKIDNVVPGIQLGRLLAFLLGKAKDFAIRIFATLEMEGETRKRLLLSKMKTALIQRYGPHNVSLMMMCAAGRNKVVKRLLHGDNHTHMHGAQLVSSLLMARKRVSYSAKSHMDLGNKV